MVFDCIKRNLLLTTNKYLFTVNFQYYDSRSDATPDIMEKKLGLTFYADAHAQTTRLHMVIHRPYHTLAGFSLARSQILDISS